MYALVKQHAEETGSQFAAALLEDWNETVKRFTHVVPKQFVAMTKAMEEAKANNVDFNAPALGTGVRAGYGRSALTWATREDF